MGFLFFSWNKFRSTTHRQIDILTWRLLSLLNEAMKDDYIFLMKAHNQTCNSLARQR